MSHLTFPNESAEYRKARNALLFERISENGTPERVAMSELFGPHRTLILYSFMYGPDRDAPCPMCTHLLDSMNGAAVHVGQRASFYIVAKSPIARLASFARERRWAHLRFLSTAGNTYDADYFGDTSKLPPAIRKEREIPDGEDWDETMYNVFRLDDGKVRHFWGSELTWAPEDAGMDHRSGDAMSSMWGLLDLTPAGREQFYPKLTY